MNSKPDQANNRVGKIIESGLVAFETRSLGPVAPGKVRIRVVSSAICGSDLHIFKGKHPSVKLPTAIGHEFSGEIVEIGPDVQGLSLGERVTLEPVIACGTCPACMRGEYGYCAHISFAYREGDGAMADSIDALASRVFKLPDEVSWNSGALVEPLAVAVHAVRRAKVGLGDKVIVFGAGAIGMLVATVCRKSGASEVVIVDHADSRLAVALKIGATCAVNSSRESVDDVVQRVSDGRGMDFSFECIGIEATFVQAMTSLKKNGLATVVGIFEKPEITIPVTRFVTHEIKVQGSQGYCWDFPAAIDLARTLPLEQLVTHHFPLEKLQEAFETCMDKSSGAIKVLVHPRMPAKD